MKKFSGFLAVVLITYSGVMVSCGSDCDPGQIEPDQALFVNVLANGRSLTRNVGTIGANKPPDSVKIYFDGTTTAVPFMLINDSVIFFTTYNRNGLNVASQTLRIVCGNRPADLVSFDAQPKYQTDNCGDRLTFYVPENVKINGVTNINTPGNVVTINK
jgi:hypothetical protein